jgi:hypothetical protein
MGNTIKRLCARNRLRICLQVKRRLAGVSTTYPSFQMAHLTSINSIFYLLIALNAVTTVAWFFFYKPPTFAMKHESSRKVQFLKDFDYVGTLLFTMGLLLFLMGISWGGTLHPWKSAHVIATIVVGFLSLVGFFVYEAYAGLKEPLIPMHLLKNWKWDITVLLWALGAAVYYALAIIWPSMVAVLYSGGHGTMWAGWVSCISNSGILFGEFVGAGFKKKTNYQIMVVFFLGTVFLAGESSLLPPWGRVLKLREI